MNWLDVRECALFEALVVFLQVGGVLALCVSRLVREGQWARGGKVAVVLAIVGLGVVGAWCGQHDSEFGLFAGGSITVLLIGMTCGSAHDERHSHEGHSAISDPIAVA